MCEEVIVRYGKEINVTVVSLLNGAPVKDAYITVFSDEPETKITNSEGKTTFFAGEDYIFVVEAYGYNIEYEKIDKRSEYLIELTPVNEIKITDIVKLIYNSIRALKNK